MAELSGHTGAIYYSPSATSSTSANNSVVLSGGAADISGIGGSTRLVTAVKSSSGGPNIFLPWSYNVASEILTVTGGGSDTVYVDTILWGSVPTVAGGFFNWSLDCEVNMLNSTDFGSGGFQESIPGQSTWSATADRHWIDIEWAVDVGNTPVILYFYVEATSNLFASWGYVSGISPTVNVGEIVDETITMQGLHSVDLTVWS